MPTQDKLRSLQAWLSFDLNIILSMQGGLENGLSAAHVRRSPDKRQDPRQANQLLADTNQHSDSGERGADALGHPHLGLTRRKLTARTAQEVFRPGPHAIAEHSLLELPHLVMRLFCTQGQGGP